MTRSRYEIGDMAWREAYAEAKAEWDATATDEEFDRELERRKRDAKFDRACDAIGPYLLGIAS